MTMISDKTVAMTILEQLGGLGRLKAMIGIKNVTYTVNSVSFWFMKGRGGVAGGGELSDWDTTQFNECV
jgi:hypothetical protein